MLQFVVHYAWVEMMQSAACDSVRGSLSRTDCWVCAVQKFMANIYKKHDNKFGNKERYLHSLNNWLETMPEHCMEDVDNIWLASSMGWSSVVLACVTGYVALTATVVSGKKDY